MTSTDDNSYAYVTLATNDEYIQGALVLADSLRSVETKHKLAILVTEGVSTRSRDKLHKVFDVVQNVDVLNSKDKTNLLLLERPELGVTFTKVHCWKLTQFSKCVFLDADTMVIKNCDELFEREELSAVPDIGWPDCFNSGVFVFKPSVETYDKLLNFAAKNGSFDGGDQGLLNMFFSDWATKDISTHLSFIYNMNISRSYSYLPAFNKFGKDVKIVHFMGPKKPWMFNYNKTTKSVEPADDHNVCCDHLNLWWSIYLQNVESEMCSDSGISKSLSDIRISSPVKDIPKSVPTPERRLSQDSARMRDWESGHIDYMGRDSFENIQKKLDEVIAGIKD